MVIASDAFLTSLGRLANASAALEYFLAIAVDWDAQAGRSGTELATAFRNSPLRLPPDVDRDEFADELRDLFVQRNRLIHSHWLRGTDEPDTHVGTKAKRPNGRPPKDLTSGGDAEETRITAAEIDALTEHLDDLLYRLFVDVIPLNSQIPEDVADVLARETSAIAHQDLSGR